MAFREGHLLSLRGFARIAQDLAKGQFIPSRRPFLELRQSGEE
jgi:hypothetical protein